MKRFLSLIFFISAFAGWAQSENFEWMTGVWQRDDNPTGMKTTESWWKSTDSLYLGQGITLKGKDTVFSELLELRAMRGDWYYIVKNVNPEPTLFKLIEIDDAYFLAANPLNDFPQHISVRRIDEKIEVILYNEYKRVTLTFSKANDS